MSSVILILEPTIDNHGPIKDMIELSVEHLDHCVFVNAWDTVGFVFRYETRQLRRMNLVNVHGGLMA